MLGVIGDIVQDVVVWAHEPVRPATDTAAEVVMRRGGSAANVAAFAGRRYPTRFIGCVGDDLGGHVVEQELLGYGVDVRLQRRGDTGMIVVLVDQTGERMMFPSRGASGLLEEVDPVWLDRVELLHLTGYSLQQDPTATSVLSAARRVKETGGQLCLDVSSTGMVEAVGRTEFAELVRELAPDYISANQDETALLALDDPRPVGLARDLDRTVVLARAGREATRVLRRGEEVARVDVIPAESVRDLTGAGDAFNAGFLTTVLSDHSAAPDLVAAVRAGHALARRVLAHPGASEGEDPEDGSRTPAQPPGRA